ncbi:MAG: WG repeat-containing protein [Candidatus Gastranaerophilales bacterium]|nr:WG repeat-containing protein [Candidatus Gastranaerophilales bacterium]
MRKFFIILFSILILQTAVLANDEQSCSNIKVYGNENNTLFGLKCEDETIITEAIYPKLIKLSDTSWIVQYKNKFGIINDKGEFIIKPKYRHAERLFGKYAKLGNTSDYGLYDAQGNVIIKPEYTKIDTLFGKMFLTCKNYKYGVVDMNGNVLLDNKFDDIYMPTFKTMRIKYQGQWFEIEKITDNEIALPENATKVRINDVDYKITELITNTGIISGYSAVTLTDYLIKIISSISPAYEDTIDELMLSHGTDTVTIFMKFSWLPKFPVTYAQKYSQNLIAPNNGPLSEVKDNLIKQLK